MKDQFQARMLRIHFGEDDKWQGKPLHEAIVAKCLELAESAPIDLAILDINLAGEVSFPAALVLRRRGIPFVFSSGYGDEDLPEAWRDQKILQKPYDTRQLNAALIALHAA